MITSATLTTGICVVVVCHILCTTAEQSWSLKTTLIIA